MWLIHTKKLKLYEFIGNRIPPYAILSHTWGAHEISFSEFQKLSLNSPNLHGTKVACCCQIAASHGYSYVWIDTCCIDKSSSAELSEAINSMYRWYSDAKVCYVYLTDISVKASMLDEEANKLKNSRWFTRGWTLQELLAPRSIMFYDRDWIEIGTKQSLKSFLSEAAHISTRHLFHPSSASVAAKMSWAARRSTTRTEDVAYCLLGLFNVNMPLLYGEGFKAFQRLQQAILGSSADESIFAWVKRPEKLDYPVLLNDHVGILATHPYFFLKSGNIVRQGLGFKELRSFYFTNGRLETTLRARKYQDPGCGQCESWEIPLACAEASEVNKPLGLLLHRHRKEVLALKKCNSDFDMDYLDGVSLKKSEFDTLTAVRFHVVLEDPAHPNLDSQIGLPRQSWDENRFHRLRVSFTQSAREAFPLAAYLPNNVGWTETPNSINLKAESMTFGRDTGPAFTIDSFCNKLGFYDDDSVKIFRANSLKYLLSDANKDRYKEPLTIFRRPSEFFSKRIGNRQHLIFTTMPENLETIGGGQRTLHLRVDVSEFDVSNVL
ncbi:MAG: hypothetical protein LQ342_001761 [Letrouitia transgressa]|nr:MAG: hypothetical protein LQ342_001761 [Letrouitia transgressa]